MITKPTITNGRRTKKTVRAAEKTATAMERSTDSNPNTGPAKRIVRNPIAAKEPILRRA
jgi:hypothetical protein